MPSIYRNLTDALAGSREYSATEKLLQVYTEGRSIWSCSTPRQPRTRSTFSTRRAA